MADPSPPDEDLRADKDVPEGVRYDADLAVHEPMSVPAEPIVPSRRRGSLILLPLGLAALCLLVYLLFGLIASEGKSSSDYLDDIRARGGGAWQAAFELSRMIGREDPSRRPPRFVPRLLALFGEARGDDPRLRRYLALTLAQMRDPRAAEALLGALEEADLMTRIYAVGGLGALGDPRAAAPLQSLLESDEPDLRKAAAHALGSAGTAASLPGLRAALNDPVVDVAWNAALSLARLGDPSCIPTLARMLDRGYLDTVRRADGANVPRPMTEPQKERALVSALGALTMLGDRGSLEAVRDLRDFDPSLAVRQAAAEALDILEGRGGPGR
ncbi:MAG: HEAT repeat domain-containing protein [Acidobacteriota bacterium]